SSRRGFCGFPWDRAWVTAHGVCLLLLGYELNGVDDDVAVGGGIGNDKGRLIGEFVCANGAKAVDHASGDSFIQCDLRLTVRMNDLDGYIRRAVRIGGIGEANFIRARLRKRETISRGQLAFVLVVVVQISRADETA